VLFLMAFSAPVVCLLLDAHASHLRCVHNDIQTTTALYVAQAGVHDAAGELLADPAWRTGFTDKAFPAGLGHTYTVTAADGGAGEIIITSPGRTATAYPKTITVTLSGF